jgi:hypothetical protein
LGNGWLDNDIYLDSVYQVVQRQEKQINLKKK